jgi:hypothetical protein
MAQAGLTQALAVAVIGIVILMVDTFCLGTVVDYFVNFAATVPIYSPIMRECMLQIMVFGQWFYYVIMCLGALFVVYPIIYVIKRHRYMDIENVQDEQIYQQ